MRFAASASLNAATCTQYGPFDEVPLVVATADGILLAATRDRSVVISRLFVATVAGLAAATFRAGCAVVGVASGVLAGSTGVAMDDDVVGAGAVVAGVAVVEATVADEAGAGVAVGSGA